MKEQKGFGSLSSALTASYCLSYFVKKMFRTIQYPTFFPLHLLPPFVLPSFFPFLPLSSKSREVEWIDNGPEYDFQRVKGTISYTSFTYGSLYTKSLSVRKKNQRIISPCHCTSLHVSLLGTRRNNCHQT